MDAQQTFMLVSLGALAGIASTILAIRFGLSHVSFPMRVVVVLLVVTLTWIVLRVEDTARLARELSLGAGRYTSDRVNEENVRRIALDAVLEEVRMVGSAETQMIAREEARTVAREEARTVAREEARTVALAEARRALEEELVITPDQTSVVGLMDIFRRRFGDEVHEFDRALVEDIQAGDAVALDVDEMVVVRLVVSSDDANATYVIEARGDDQWDPYLYLYRVLQDDTLDRVAVDDDSGTGLDARLQRPLGAGTYFVVVEGVLGGSGQCTVAVDRIDASP